MTIAQPDLFDTSAMPGLAYQAGFVTPQEEQALIAAINWSITLRSLSAKGRRAA